MSTDELLNERGKTHGDYDEQAAMTQRIKQVFREGKNWPMLSDMQADALEMVAVKISRILTGNPDEDDHWKDGAGYFTLPLKFK